MKYRRRGRSWTRVVTCLGVLVALLSTDARAESEESLFDFSGTMMTVDLFGSAYAVSDDQQYNPENLVANLPQRLDLIFRPKFSVSMDSVRAWISPRVGVRWMSLRDVRSANPYAYVQDWGVLATPTDDLTLEVGRRLMFWGPSLFASPSNPFYASVAQVNPFIEPGARELMSVRYSPSYDFGISLIANPGLGRDDNEYEEFKPTIALKADANSESVSGSVVAAARSDLFHFGALAQWTVSDALLLYLDAGLRTQTESLVPVTASGTLGWDVQRRDAQIDYDLLPGLSYTFENGTTVTLEYRHNSQGLNSSENDRLEALSAASHAALGTPLEPLALGTLAQTAVLNTRSLRQNYLHSQFLVREVMENLQLNLLGLFNLDDQSLQVVGVLNYYLTDRIRLSTVLIGNAGDKGSEFLRYFDYAGFVGIKYSAL